VAAPVAVAAPVTAPVTAPTKGVSVVASIHRVDLPQMQTPKTQKKTVDTSPERLPNYIRNAKDISDILETIKQPNHVHISTISDVDSKLAKMFGLNY
jgi:hypothetical protein